MATTLYDTALLLYEELFGPLEPARADKVYEQYAVLGTALQVPARSWPADRAAFRAYWEQTIDTLEVSDEARRVARDLLSAEHAPLLLKATMPLNRFLTAAWLPERIRAQYGISWDTGQQRRYELLRKVGAPVYRLLPVPLREAPKIWYLHDMRKRLAT